MDTTTIIRRTVPRATGLSCVAVPLVLAACDPPRNEMEESTYAEHVSETRLVPPRLSSDLSRSRSQAEGPAPQLIRTGTARIEVTDLRVSMSAAETLASSVNGFVVTSELNEGRQGARTAALTLRVPADSFQIVVGRLSELGRVLSASSSTQDISREYVDVETRLSVGEETVARLRALASRTGILEDMLAAERELARALTELEGLKGQLRFYDRHVAESDLWITFIEPGAVIVPSPFQPAVEAFRDATGTLARSLAGLIEAAVFLAPWLVVISLLWVGFGRRLLARRARRRMSVA